MNPKAVLRMVIFRFFIIYALLFVFFVFEIIANYFGNPPLEQIIFHVKYHPKTLTEFDEEIFWIYFSVLIQKTLLLSIVICIIEYFLIRAFFEKKVFIRNILGRYLPVYILLIVTFLSLNNVKAYEYIASYFGEDYFGENYIEPSNVKLFPKDTKNLVLIYVEGLENTYGDDKVFSNDLLKSLKEKGGVSFSKFHQMPGTNWTISAMLSSQCGMPLKVISISDHNNQNNFFDSFFPGAVCLAEVLKKNGYHNVYMGGASLNFAAKGKYLAQHGYDEIFGRDEWVASNKYTEEDMNGWGLNDDDLFVEAKLKIDELIKKNRLFNLTLLTVNTHPPSGHNSKSCPKKENVSKGKNFEYIIECTAKIIAEFVNYIKEKNYDEKINIVILGDHLSTQNSVFHKILKSSTERYVYNQWISKKDINKNTDEITHFDIAPSILEFIGIDVEGDSFGLGYSAFNETDVQPKENRIQEMKDKLLNRSNLYNEIIIGK